MAFANPFEWPLAPLAETSKAPDRLLGPVPAEMREGLPAFLLNTGVIKRTGLSRLA